MEFMRPNTVINVNTAKPGPKVSALTDAQKVRARSVYLILREHIRGTEEQWLEGFCRDQAPEREIQIWEYIANAYEKRLMLCNTAVKRKRLFKKLLLKSMHQDPIIAKAATK